MIEIACVICGNNKRIEKLYPSSFSLDQLSRETYSARRFPDKVHYQIVRCKGCGLVFSSPIISPEKIIDLYKKSVCTYTEQIPFLTKTYLSLFHRTKNYLPKDPRVLEIGCGSGFFLEALKQQGIKKIFGVEPGKRMVSSAPSYIRKNIIADIFRSNQFPSNSFDLVCCFHTLDHILNLQEVIDEVYKILRVGGVVLIVVHDVKGLSVRLFGEKSPIFDIEHVYLFNKVTLQTLFSLRKFHIIATGDLINRYPLSYWWWMSGLPKLVKRIGGTVLRYLGIGNIEMSMAAGNIFLIAQKSEEGID